MTSPSFWPLILALVLNGIALRGATPPSLRDWPADTAPQEIGKRIAERFMATRYGNGDRPPRQGFIIYPITCTWYGALTFAQLTKDDDLTKRLIARYEPLFGAEANLLPPPVHVDNNVFGAVPLEIYLQTKEPRYREAGLLYADTQWAQPTPEQLARLNPELRATAGEALQAGLTWQTRFWIDDMYMITMVQTQAYRATGEIKYVDRAALEAVAYLDKLQQPNGLFYHAPDVPFFWGRGDGWFAAGMAELLRSMPASHPQRPRILAGFQKMMAMLLAYQDAEGMWHQLIDRPESWAETSGTAMFTFAFITGVKHGWLEADTYGPAARKGWLALVKRLDENANLRDVCQGTNKRNDLQYYLDRQRNVGDLHGQAPMLWCVSALLR